MVEARQMPAMRLALGTRKVCQKEESGMPEIFTAVVSSVRLMIGFGRGGAARKELKRGYWKIERPRVAADVQRGRMRFMGWRRW